MPFFFFCIRIVRAGSSAGEHKHCTESFLFSLVNPSGAEPTKLPIKSSANQYGIYCDARYGPTFGNLDLRIASKANVNSESYSNIGESYECPSDVNCETFLAGQTNFVVNELEVFSFQAD